MQRKSVTSGTLVAIDGPSGSGKSTVSKLLAQKLGLEYLDTGAMYRALTWYALNQGVDLDDHKAVRALADMMPLRMDSNPMEPHFFIGTEEITSEIRSTKVAENVSSVARNLLVREWMAEEQRRRMIQAREEGTGMVSEGRDITTVVCPDADVRVLLVADQEARLRRRALEIFGNDSPESIEATREQVIGRDQSDSQVVQFMKPAQGVKMIDSSNLSIEEVVETISELAKNQ